MLTRIMNFFYKKSETKFYFNIPKPSAFARVCLKYSTERQRERETFYFTALCLYIKRLENEKNFMRIHATSESFSITFTFSYSHTLTKKKYIFISAVTNDATIHLMSYHTIFRLSGHWRKWNFSHLLAELITHICEKRKAMAKIERKKGRKLDTKDLIKCQEGCDMILLWFFLPEITAYWHTHNFMADTRNILSFFKFLSCAKNFLSIFFFFFLFSCESRSNTSNKIK